MWLPFVTKPQHSDSCNLSAENAKRLHWSSRWSTGGVWLPAAVVVDAVSDSCLSPVIFVGGLQPSAGAVALAVAGSHHFVHVGMRDSHNQDTALQTGDLVCSARHACFASMNCSICDLLTAACPNHLNKKSSEALHLQCCWLPCSV